jgi:hypothetical protein
MERPMAHLSNPDHVNPVQWQQAQGVARQTCARFFRDGGTPEDALKAFGVSTCEVSGLDWDRAVDAIAQALCAAPQRRAA